MKSYLLWPLVCVALPACGGGSSGSDSATSFSCEVTIPGASSTCQLYEATGSDAARVIGALKAGCVDQQGASLMTVDACSTQGSLGGCKTRIAISNDTHVTAFVTSFSYVPTGGSLGPATSSEAQASCADASGEFVPPG